MATANGVHHLAINVQEIEAPLEFFTQACGMEMKAVYWMHGMKDAYHVFLKLNDHSYVALCRVPEDDGHHPSEENVGMFSLRRDSGAMQHVSFNVDTYDDLMAMQDRVRASGYQTFGPIDHGLCHSIYIPGAPERMMVEFSWSEEGIDPEKWIDPSTIAHSGLTAEQVERYCNPPAFQGRGGSIEQPAHDPSHPQILTPVEAELLGDDKKRSKFETSIHEAGDSVISLASR